MEDPEEAVLAEEELFAPQVGEFGEIRAEEDIKAPGSSDVSQAWQDNNIQNIMSNYGLVQSLQDLNMEALTGEAVNNIMRRYEEQNGSYGLTEPQFYEVIDELRGDVGGGRKRKGRKTKKGGKKSKKSRKSRKIRKTRKGKKARKGRKTRR